MKYNTFYNFDYIVNRLQSDEHLINTVNSLLKYDRTTFFHSYNVSITSAIIGSLMSIDEKEMINLIYGAALHDIGKTKIDNTLLNYPGRYSKEQMDIMKKHPIYSYEIAKENGFNDEICTLVLQHHENVNGSGYPIGLIGSQIQLNARILHVSDVFNALIEKRAYKESKPMETVIEFINRMAGKMFDEEVVRAITDISPSIHVVMSELQKKYDNVFLQQSLYNNLLQLKETKKK